METYFQGRRWPPGAESLPLKGDVFQKRNAFVIYMYVAIRLKKIIIAEIPYLRNWMILCC